MRYIVIANHGDYTAGQVLDFNDDEAVANLMRTTGVALLRMLDAPPPVATAVSAPLPKPERRSVPVIATVEPVAEPAPARATSQPAKSSAKRG